MTAKKEYENIDGILHTTCKVCGETKQVSEFRRKRLRKDGTTYYFPMCKVCERKQNLQRHYDKYRDNQHARKSGYRYILKTKYGLSETDFSNMYEKQNGKCFICGDAIRNPFISMSGKNQAVDHCHETGNVRGLLCKPCNTGLGMFQENETILLKAIDYLRLDQNDFLRHRGKRT